MVSNKLLVVGSCETFHMQRSLIYARETFITEITEARTM